MKFLEAVLRSRIQTQRLVVVVDLPSKVRGNPLAAAVDVAAAVVAAAASRLLQASKLLDLR